MIDDGDGRNVQSREYIEKVAQNNSVISCEFYKYELKHC